MTKLVMKKTAALIPYVNNSRTHSEHQIKQIAASIKEFGFLNPVVVDGDDGIVAGHGRVEAAKLLGLDEVPTIDASYLSDAQRKAFVIADNKLALNAGWDMDTLTIEIEGLQESDFDIDVLGFDENELAEILRTVDGLDDMPELPDGEKEPYQQKTFNLHDEQAQIIEAALTLARTRPEIDTGLNENSNGNAITYICDQWLKKNA